MGDSIHTAWINFRIQKFHNYRTKYADMKGTAVEQWLMSCATNRKVAGSIPDGVSGIFIDKNLPTQPGVKTACA